MATVLCERGLTNRCTRQCTASYRKTYPASTFWLLKEKLDEIIDAYLVPVDTRTPDTEIGQSFVSETENVCVTDSGPVRALYSSSKMFRC